MISMSTNPAVGIVTPRQAMNSEFAVSNSAIQIPELAGPILGITLRLTDVGYREVDIGHKDLSLDLVDTNDVLSVVAHSGLLS